MAKRKSTSSSRRRKTQKSRALESITGNDALSILKVLAKRDPTMAKMIDEVALEMFRGVSVDDVADQVQWELEFLNVEDVWDRSGSTRNGYVDPGDAAWEMFEETLQPFLDEAEKYKRLSMPKEADSCWKGILKGIYDFGRESSTEYKDWAVDAPGEYFGLILDDWKKQHEGRQALVGMRKFIENNCPDWIERALVSLRSRKRPT